MTGDRMLDTAVERSLKMLDGNKCHLVNAGENSTLTEANINGYVNVETSFQNDAIIIETPEKNVFPYLPEVLGYRRCCDKLIFSFSVDHNKLCVLHALEFKRAVGINELMNDIGIQLKMGIMNAKALAGFLGVDFNGRIKLYVAFRNDKTDDSTIAKRVANNARAAKRLNLWKRGKICLDMPWGSTEYPLLKIGLDAMFKGSLVV